MGETEISWTHRPGTVGKTWNPIQGCRRISAGCERCYAERLASRFAEDGWSQGLINLKTRKWNGVVRLAAHKLAEPLRWRKSATVFTNSMSDLFHESLTNEQIAAVFGVMAAAPQHTFQCLTKRAKRMREWFEWIEKRNVVEGASEWNSRAADCWEDARDAIAAAGIPIHGSVWDSEFLNRAHTVPWPLPSVWLGVSVENQEAADERIPELLETPAAVRFLSCEPLIGEVDLDLPRCEGRHCGPDEWGVADDGATPWCNEHDQERSYGHWLHLDGGIDWVISGCESGPNARPCSVEWLRSLRDQCAAAGVPFFLKQAVPSRDPHRSKCPECGEQIRWYVHGPKHSSASCACTVEGAEGASWHPSIGVGDGSKRKAGGVIELPYLDGEQHAEFPEVRNG